MALVVDEISQMMEANAVFPIAHALKGARLKRERVIATDTECVFGIIERVLESGKIRNWRKDWRRGKPLLEVSLECLKTCP